MGNERHERMNLERAAAGARVRSRKPIFANQPSSIPIPYLRPIRTLSS